MVPCCPPCCLALLPLPCACVCHTALSSPDRPSFVFSPRLLYSLLLLFCSSCQQLPCLARRLQAAAICSQWMRGSASEREPEYKDGPDSRGPDSCHCLPASAIGNNPTGREQDQKLEWAGRSERGRCGSGFGVKPASGRVIFRYVEDCGGDRRTGSGS